MTTVASKHGLRAAATEKRNRHAQRTPLPPRPGQVAAAKEPIDLGPQYGKMTQPQLFAKAQELGLNPPKSAPKGKLLTAILARERSSRAETAPAAPAAPGTAQEPKGASKAKAFASLATAAEWDAWEPTFQGESVIQIVVRGSETIRIQWDDGVFNYDESAYVVGDRSTKPRNVSAARALLGRAPEVATQELKRVASNRAWKRNVETPVQDVSRLPFDPETVDENELWKHLNGRRVTWFNRHANSEESGRLTTNSKFFRVTEVAGERVVHFTSKEGGFRACRLKAILRISR